MDNNIINWVNDLNTYSKITTELFSSIENFIGDNKTRLTYYRKKIKETIVPTEDFETLSELLNFFDDCSITFISCEHLIRFLLRPNVTNIIYSIYTFETIKEKISAIKNCRTHALLSFEQFEKEIDIMKKFNIGDEDSLMKIITTKYRYYLTVRIISKIITLKENKEIFKNLTLTGTIDTEEKISQTIKKNSKKHPIQQIVMTYGTNIHDNFINASGESKIDVLNLLIPKTAETYIYSPGKLTDFDTIIKYGSVSTPFSGIDTGCISRFSLIEKTDVNPKAKPEIDIKKREHICHTADGTKYRTITTNYFSEHNPVSDNIKAGPKIRLKKYNEIFENVFVEDLSTRLEYDNLIIRENIMVMEQTTKVQNNKLISELIANFTDEFKEKKPQTREETKRLITCGYYITKTLYSMLKKTLESIKSNTENETQNFEKKVSIICQVVEKTDNLRAKLLANYYRFEQSGTDFPLTVKTLTNVLEKIISYGTSGPSEKNIDLDLNVTKNLYFNLSSQFPSF
jgi:hypothetical protein